MNDLSTYKAMLQSADVDFKELVSHGNEYIIVEITIGLTGAIVIHVFEANTGAFVDAGVRL